MPDTQIDMLAGVLTSVAVKAPVACSSTGPLTLSGAQTVNGVTLAVTQPRSRALVKDQVDAKTNGIYDVQDAAWTRSLDFDGAYDAVTGTVVHVLGGTVNSNTFWELTCTDSPIVIDTSLLTFELVQIGGGGDSFLADTPHAQSTTIARRLQTEVRASDTLLKDDAVTTGVVGTDNAAYLSDILADCATKRRRFVLDVAGYGGRYYLGSTVTIPSNLQWDFEGGRIAFFGSTNLYMFRGIGISDVTIRNPVIMGDQFGGHSRARDNSFLARFSNSTRVVIDGGSVTDFFGDWGWVFDGTTQAEFHKVLNHRMVNSVCATSIYMSGLVNYPEIRNVYLSGDKLRLLANGVTIDDRILLAFADTGISGKQSVQPIIENVVAAHTSASAVKIGNIRQGRIRGITAYCCAFPLYIYSSGVDHTNSAVNVFIDDVTIDGSREGSFTQNAFTSIGGQDITATNVKVRNSTAAQAESGAAAFTNGVLVDSGSQDIKLVNFDIEGVSTGFALQGKNQTLIRPRVSKATVAAVQVIGNDPTGFLRIEDAQWDSLFAVGAGTYRAIEINGAANTTLTEITIDGVNRHDGDITPGSAPVEVYYNGALAIPAITQHDVWANGMHIDDSDELTATATYDWSSVADGAWDSHDFTILGVVLGDKVEGLSLDVSTAGLIMTAEVTATNTITVSRWNKTGGAINLASAVHRFHVRRAIN